jgi:hypothetical protein
MSDLATLESNHSVLMFDDTTLLAAELGVE